MGGVHRRFTRRFFCLLFILLLACQMSFPMSASADDDGLVTTEFPAELTQEQSFQSPDFGTVAGYNEDSLFQIPGDQFKGKSGANFNFYAVDLTPAETGTYTITVKEAHLTPRATEYGYIDENGDPVGADDDTAIFL